MKLQFQRLILSGFKSFTTRTVLELHSAGPGLHFIRGRNRRRKRLGSNGAGKSSLWDALCWCLYGRTVDGLRNPDVRSWSGKGPTEVTVELSVDGVMYVITRTIGPNRLTLNDRVVGPERIERLLGLTMPVFCHTILLGQGQPLFFDLKPTAKLDLFTEVLQLQRWDHYSQLATQRVRVLEAEAATVHGQLQVLQQRHEQLRREREQAERVAKDWAQEQQATITKQSKRIDELQQQIKLLDQKVIEADLNLDSAGTELKALPTQIDKVQFDLRIVQRNQDDFQRELTRAGHQLQQAQADLQRLGDGTCPTCGQKLTGGKLKQQRDQVMREIKRCQSVQKTGIPGATINRLGELQRQLTILHQVRDQLQDKVMDAQSRLNQYTPQLAEARTELRMLQGQKEDLINQRNVYDEQLQKLRRGLKVVTAELRAAEDRHRLLQRRQTRAKFWIKGFDEVRLQIIAEVLMELELTGNCMLAEIGLQGWQLHYAVEREGKTGSVQRGITVTVLSPDNDQRVSWKVWSGGEGQRLRIVGALSLSEVLLNHAAVTTSLEVLDEPTQHLSGEGINDLCEFLAGRADNLQRQVWYTDQHSYESGSFASVITVSKDRTGSHLDGGSDGSRSVEQSATTGS